MKSKHSLFIILLCSVHFFGLYHKLGSITFYIIDGFAILIILLEFKYRRNNSLTPSNFKNLLFIFFVALIVSAISCYFFHGQSIFKTILAMRYFFYFALYFVLSKTDLEVDKLEKLALYGSVFYILIFTIQFVLFPIEIVPLGRIEDFENGFLRVRIEGAGFLMLAGYLKLNRFLISRKKLDLFIYLICLIFLIALGFRTLFIAAILSSLYLIVIVAESTKISIKYISYFIIIASIVLNISFVQEMINSYVEKTNTQFEQNETYIRFLTFDFFYNQVNINEISILFGNGFPQEDSDYGKLVLGFGAEEKGYIFADIGLIGFVFIFGGISCFVFILIAIKAILSRTRREDKYINVYFLYILISSITTVEIYRQGMFGIEALLLYLIDRSVYLNKQREFELSKNLAKPTLKI
jgi:hypothetical protein